MVQKLKILLIVILLLKSVWTELLQVALIFRHGARYHYYNTYRANETKKMWGELTAVGMRQHYTFGQILRTEYIDKLGFLSENYNPKQIQVYSTTINRAIASVISHLYGFYPIGTGPKCTLCNEANMGIPPYKNYTDNINDTFAVPFGHQIIPINIAGPMQQCSRQAFFVEKNTEQAYELVNQMNQHYHKYLVRISKIFNITPILNILTLDTIYDTIVVDRFLKRSLPSELTEADFLVMQHIQYFSYLLKLNKELARAITTRKFQKIIENCDNRIKNRDYPLKWTYFSGHDIEMYALLNILNISSYTCTQELYRYKKTQALNCREGAEFASSLLFELHRDEIQENHYDIMIKYNGKYVNLCEKQSFKCAYHEWKERILKYSINFTQFCQNRPNMYRLMQV